MAAQVDMGVLRDLLIILNLKRIYNRRKKRRERRVRSCWRKAWVARRELQGRSTLSLVHDELAIEDPLAFKNFLRMDEHTFNKLLSLVDGKIQKRDTTMRVSISSRDRLSVTLRFLATGESYTSLAYSTRIPACTLSLIIPAVCQAIYEELNNDYLKVPRTCSEWHIVADEMLKLWNYPNCLGAMDGKHINFRPPRSAGSTYFNYKSFHSIVLLAVVDANCKCIYVDVGTNGRVSDGGVYRDSDLARALNSNALNIPPPVSLPGRDTPVSFVIVADDAFTLSENLMKPYPNRALSLEERIHNYRLSRARRVSENAFGILANRFRVFLTTLNISAHKARVITLAACALHNFLRTEIMNSYMPSDSVDREENGVIVLGSWRAENAASRALSQQAGNRVPRVPMKIRDEFRDYFSNEGTVPWQDDYIFNC